MNDAGISRLSTIEQWERFVSENRGRQLWVLKHSLVCPLSRDGLREFEQFFETVAGEDAGGLAFGIVEIQNARELSEEIGRRTGVRHESPQALLIVDDEVRWSASHWQITASALSHASGVIEAAVGAESE